PGRGAAAGVQGGRGRDAADAGHGDVQRHAGRDAVRHLHDAGVLLRDRLDQPHAAVQQPRRPGAGRRLAVRADVPGAGQRRGGAVGGTGGGAPLLGGPPHRGAAGGRRQRQRPAQGGAGGGALPAEGDGGQRRRQRQRGGATPARREG